MTKKRFSGLKIFLLFLLVCGVLVVLIGLFGKVTGQEFSPNRFARRNFTYYQLPLIGTQLWPVSFSKPFAGGSALETHLRKSGYLSSVRSKAARWDIVTLNELGQVHDNGDAEILLKYLDQPGALGTENWLEWTTNRKNDQIAKTFWPLVADLAYEELYILLPDLFDMARRCSNVNEFVTSVQQEVPIAIRKVAESEKARGETERATQLELLAEKIAIFEATPNKAPEADETDIEAEADPQDL